MNVLRTLLSLGIEEKQCESVDVPHHIQQFNPQSAQQLPRPPRLLQRKSAVHGFAHSSINLNNIPKSIRGRRNIDNASSRTSQSELGDECEGEIHISLATDAQAPKINLTLISDSDLSKFNDMTLETETETPIPDIYPAMQCFASSLHSITSSYSMEGMDPSMSDVSWDPAYTTSELQSVLTRIECKEDDARSIGEDVELALFDSDDFKFMYQIGFGAFGIVDKSFHLKSCQIVAMKHCRTTNEVAMKSFKKEIQICSEFRACPYIINMVEYGISDKHHKICIALEYMNMCSLNKNRVILKNNTINRIKHICFCILHAMNALHSKLYVHNDIKPANILFNDNGDVKLSDFGCVKQMKDIDTPLTMPCGTEFYQSYEKRFVSPIVYTTQSDIYSFGITICELLDDECTMDKTQAIPFRIPRRIVEKYSSNADLLDFLNQCLQRNASQRSNCEQLLNHSFLKDYKRDDVMIQPVQDIDDLEFMIQTLIDYYTNYKKTSKMFSAVLTGTPMDHTWSDTNRLQNIAKFSGCGTEFVRDYIFQCVKNVSDKYLKL